LSSAELSSFLDQGNISDKLGMADKRAIAATRMRSLVDGKEQEVRLAETAVECASFIVLKHLEHFFLVVSTEQSYAPARGRKFVGKLISV
jgi:hypothetical protein